MTKRIILVGACYLDTILTVPHFPAEDSKLRATALTRRLGGNVPNTAQVLSQLLESGGRNQTSLSLCVVLPSETSAAVRDIKEGLGDEVDLAACVYREGVAEAASSYIVKSEGSGSRTIVNFNALEEMGEREFMERIAGVVSSGDEIWCHFEGRIPDVTLECMRALRQTYPDIKLSVEVEKPGRQGLEALAAEADAVFYSRSWAEDNGHKSAGECLRAQAAMHESAWAHRNVTLCCTWGANGATAMQVPSGEQAHFPAFVTENRPLVDAIGAGDTFISGMLYALSHAHKTSLQDRLSFANELAGRKVTQEGFKGLGEAMRYRLSELS